MNNKYVMVPFLLYDSLMKNKDPLIKAKEKLDSTLKDKKQDVSNRNILHNQRLVSLLNQKKEAENKPIPVKFNEQELASFPNKKLVTLDDEGSPESEVNKKTLKKDDESSIMEFPFDDSSYDETSEEMTDPKTALLNLIEQNLNDFKIDENNRVLKDNNSPVKKSDYKKIIAHLVEGPLSKAPNGKAQFIKIIKANPEAEKLYNKIVSKSPAKLRSNKQYGKGFKFKINIW